MEAVVQQSFYQSINKDADRKSPHKVRQTSREKLQTEQKRTRNPCNYTAIIPNSQTLEVENTCSLQQPHIMTRSKSPKDLSIGRSPSGTSQRRIKISLVNPVNQIQNRYTDSRMHTINIDRQKPLIRTQYQNFNRSCSNDSNHKKGKSFPNTLHLTMRPHS